MPQKSAIKQSPPEGCLRPSRPQDWAAWSSPATKAGAPYLTTLFVGRCGKFHCSPAATLGISIDLRGINVKFRELPTSPHKKRGEIWGTRLGGRGRPCGPIRWSKRLIWTTLAENNPGRPWATFSRPCAYCRPNRYTIPTLKPRFFTCVVLPKVDSQYAGWIRKASPGPRL
jgi:hypothetical protein